MPSPLLFHFPSYLTNQSIANLCVHPPLTTWPCTSSHFFTGRSSCRRWLAGSAAGSPCAGYGRTQVGNRRFLAECRTKGAQRKSSATITISELALFGFNPLPPKQFGMGYGRCRALPHRLLPQPSSSPALRFPRLLHRRAGLEGNLFDKWLRRTEKSEVAIIWFPYSDRMVCSLADNYKN